MDNILNKLKTGLSKVVSNIHQDFNNFVTQIKPAPQTIPMAQQGLSRQFNNFINYQMNQPVIGPNVPYNPLTPINIMRFTKDYAKNQIIDPVIQGTQTMIKAPTLPGKGLGLLQAGGGVISAIPEVVPFNLAVGAIAGGIKSVRTGTPLDKNIYSGMTKPTSIAQQGLGIENPWIALGVDLLVTHKLSGGMKTAGTWFERLGAAKTETSLKDLMTYEDQLAKLGYTAEERAKIGVTEGKQIIQDSTPATPAFLKNSSKPFGGFNFGEWLGQRVESIKAKKTPDLLTALTNNRDSIASGGVDANKINLGFMNRVKNLGIDANTEWRLVQYSELSGKEAEIFARQNGLTQDILKKAQPLLEEHKTLNDAIFKKAQEAGFSLNYLKDHILHSFMESPEKVDEVLQGKGISFKPGFVKKRWTPPYSQVEGILTPKYTTFGQLDAAAMEMLQKSIADRTLAEYLKTKGIIQPADVAPKGWKPIMSDRFPKDNNVPYYAAPNDAVLLNNVFGGSEQGTISKALDITGKVSNKMQDILLTGGAKTVNSFTIGQTIKDMATGLGDAMTGHPIRGFKTATAPLGAMVRDWIPGMSRDFETNHMQSIKELAENGHGYGGSFNYKELQPNVKEQFNLEKAIKTGSKLWDSISNYPTFKRFLFQRKVSLFENFRDSLVSQGKPYEEAVKTASNQLKAYDGVINTLGKDPDIQNILKSFFMAPQYREALLNTGINVAKGFTTNLLSPEYAQSRRLGIGLLLTYLAYNGLQMKLTGKPMWNNPPGKEFELVIPSSDGKTYISIPWMPSSTAIYRRGAGTVSALMKGDRTEAARQFGSLFSVPLSKGIELATNKDYFGRDVIKPDQPLIPQLGLWAAKSFSPGYVREPLQYLQDQVAYQSKIQQGKTANPPSVLIAGMRALELPIKQGTFPNQYYAIKDAALKGLNQTEQGVFNYLHQKGTNTKRDSIIEANLRLKYPNVLKTETEIARQTAIANKTPLEPFYSLPVQYQQIILTYNTLQPGDTSRSTMVKAYPFLTEYWKAESSFFDKLNAGKPPVVSDRPQVSQDLQAKLDYYNTLPSGTGQRSRFLKQYPEVLKYFTDSRNYSNMQRAELGIPLLADSNNYQSSFRPWPKKNAKNLVSVRVRKIRVPKVTAKKIKIKAPKLLVKSYKFKPFKSKLTAKRLVV